MKCEHCRVTWKQERMEKTKGVCPSCGRWLTMSYLSIPMGKIPKTTKSHKPYDNKTIWDLDEAMEASYLDGEMLKITKEEVCWVETMPVKHFDRMWRRHINT